MAESSLPSVRADYSRRALLRGVLTGMTLVIAAPLVAACGAAQTAPSAAKPAEAARPAATTAPAAPVGQSAPTTAPAGAAPAATAAPAQVASGGFPTKPITLIVSAGPGGVFDLTCRQIAKDITPFLPQPLTIVNQGEAAGTVARVNVLQAKPDGYTMGILTDSMELQKYLQDVPWKGMTDYTLLTAVAYSSIVMAVRADAPWKTLTQLLEHSKAHPGEVRVGSFGKTGTTYLYPLMLTQAAGVEWTFVPNNAESEGVTALLGGHIDALATSIGSIMGQMRADTLTVPVVFGDTRNPVIPDVLSSSEAGFKLPVPRSTTILGGPPKIPAEIAQTLRTAIHKAIATDSYKAFLKQNGLPEAEPDDLAAEGLAKTTAKASELYKPLSEIVVKARTGG